MADAELMALLKAHRTLGSAPPEEHEWLIAHGERRSYEQGEIMNRAGQLAVTLNILFTGSVAIYTDRGVGSHKIFEWHDGDVGGTLPFSRGARAPADAVVEERLDLLMVSQDHFPELIKVCPKVTAMLVHTMLDRARQFNSNDLRDEKLLSLGRLAAGMAHELNNPASAALRSARLLADGFDSSESAALAIIDARLTDEQIEAIHEVRRLCAATGEYSQLSAMARADREEMIADWLAAHDADEDLAAALADSAITPTALEMLATKVTGDELTTALRWLAAGSLLRTLAWEIETAAARISDLVGSIKGFTYMDHAPTPEPIDIRRGIHDTLTVLGAKIREKGADMKLELASDLPRAHAVGAELNQVWMNLIDNALEAITPGGHVSVAANREGERVVVRITDDGSGIPEAIINRIFDPFFTTKPVGKGTGLGLDIVRRILKRHEGLIEVKSRPGHTQFCVSLPLAR